MRHAALAALLAVSPAAASAEDFADGLLTIQNLVRRADGSPRFQKTDFVAPQRRPGLEQLEQEQQDVYDKSLPATFIVRIGERGGANSGSGSGFFIHPDGTGMTNVHVVGNEIGKEVVIETSRGVKKAKVLAAAPGRDIAIIKVSNDSFADWPALTMGGALRAGALVWAIGNPLDQGETFSSGMVSRPRQDKLGPWQDVLQLDIMINPGNSGGALVNSRGALVGMNQAVARSAVADGMAFAIPVQELRRALDEYKRTGKLQDGTSSLGVVSDELTVVKADGPTAQAGFKVGDALVDFPGIQDAVPGRRPLAFFRAVGRAEVGRTVPVAVVRSVKAELVTADAAGGAPKARITVEFNPATGVAILPRNAQGQAFFAAVTPQSVEEIVVGSARHLMVMGEPASYGVLFKAENYTAPANLARAVLNLPVELYVPRPGPAGARIQGVIPGPVPPAPGE